MGEHQLFMGIDVSKTTLDLAIHDSEEEPWTEDNTDKGIRRVVKRLRTLQPALVVRAFHFLSAPMAPTWGSERGLSFCNSRSDWRFGWLGLRQQGRAEQTGATSPWRSGLGEPARSGGLSLRSLPTNSSQPTAIL